MAKSMSLEIFNSKKFSCDDYFFQKFDKWLWSIDNFISFKKIENWIFLITPERRFQFYIRIKERTSRPRSFIFRNGIDGMKNIRRSHSDQSLEIHQKNPYSFNWNVYIYIYTFVSSRSRNFSQHGRHGAIVHLIRFVFNFCLDDVVLPMIFRSK